MDSFSFKYLFLGRKKKNYTYIDIGALLFVGIRINKRNTNFNDIYRDTKKTGRLQNNDQKFILKVHYQEYKVNTV